MGISIGQIGLVAAAVLVVGGTLWSRHSQSPQERLGAIETAIQQGGKNVPELNLKSACIGGIRGQDVLIGIHNDGHVVHLQNTATLVKDSDQSVTIQGIRILSVADGNLQQSKQVLTQRGPLAGQVVSSAPDVQKILRANTSQVLGDMERAVGALCPKPDRQPLEEVPSSNGSTLLTWSFLEQGSQKA
jgi:hypothetical protein